MTQALEKKTYTPAEYLEAEILLEERVNFEFSRSKIENCRFI